VSKTRAPRPTDLVALVTFDGEVRENLAVTREHLGHEQETRPLAAAVEQWLHLGRRTWISVAGREIRGIATARDLSSRSAWEIDTLVESTPDTEAGREVIADLLRQAARSAAEAGATHLVLRTPAESAAEQEARRAGFAFVIRERLWTGALQPATPAQAIRVREAGVDDLGSQFMVYSRSWPVQAREALAMTQDEWRAVRDHRWLDRSDTALVAERDGRAVALARCARDTGQFTLLAEAGERDAADGLLHALTERLDGTGRQLALVASSGGEEEQSLRRAGMEPGAEYSLTCRRIAMTVREETYARAGVAIPGV
jgi:hypothetical protein